jgi:hypothetical protein
MARLVAARNSSSRIVIPKRLGIEEDGGIRARCNWMVGDLPETGTTLPDGACSFRQTKIGDQGSQGQPGCF